MPLRRSAFATLLYALLLLDGCTPVPTRCGPDDLRNGHFCYHGIDFGRGRSTLYRAGVRDGCRTAEGYFSKDYSLSASNQEYLEGWNRGRTLCRPESRPKGPVIHTAYESQVHTQSHSGRSARRRDSRATDLPETIDYRE